MRLRFHDLADSLRGQRDTRIPPPVVGIAVVVAAAVVALLVGFVLAAIAALLA